jgi:hypothetical protein
MLDGVMRPVQQPHAKQLAEQHNSHRKSAFSLSLESAPRTIFNFDNLLFRQPHTYRKNGSRSYQDCQEVRQGHH